MNDVDILVIQEHWLFDKALSSLVIQMTNIHIHGVSSIDQNVLLQGLPHVGCAFLFSKVNLDTYIRYMDVFFCKKDQVCSAYPDIVNIIIGGDFNSDLSGTNSLHTVALNDL